VIWAGAQLGGQGGQEGGEEGGVVGFWGGAEGEDGAGAPEAHVPRLVGGWVWLTGVELGFRVVQSRRWKWQADWLEVLQWVNVEVALPQKAQRLQGPSESQRSHLTVRAPRRLRQHHDRPKVRCSARRPQPLAVHLAACCVVVQLAACFECYRGLR